MFAWDDMTDPDAGESVGSISACQVKWGDAVLQPDVDLGEGR
jgi:hypothetical protein